MYMNELKTPQQYHPIYLKFSFSAYKDRALKFKSWLKIPSGLFKSTLHCGQDPIKEDKNGITVRTAIKVIFRRLTIELFNFVK